MKVFIQTIRVEPRHIDALNHANNVVYLQWVQDVAEAHWNALATREMKQQYAWVVLRHEIEYLVPVFLNEEVTAKTWVSESAGVRSVRKVEFYNASGKLVARAATTWCLLDARTGKPHRIEQDIYNLFH
jgi:acyl-CoA thioester hydrolase